MLGILVRLILNLLGLLLLPLRLLVRLFHKPPLFVAITLHGKIPERTIRTWWRRAPRTSVSDFNELCDRVAIDPRTKGLVVRIRDLDCGWATIDSLTEAISRVRKSGKKVITHLSGGGMHEYALAVSGDRLFADESAPLTLIGIAAEASFAKDTLARAGVRAEIFAIGKYKSAPETLTRRDMSPEARETIEAVLDEVFGRIALATSAERGLDLAEAKTSLTGGPYPVAEALRRRLLDELAYEDELDDRLGAKGRVAEADLYLRATRPLVRWRPLLRRRRIAIVALEGTIVSREGRVPRPLIAPEPVHDVLVALRKNRRVAGVVLSIDSRGGAADASDRIWREVLLTTREKPVVAWFRNVAASGGYYLAAPCAKIIAQPLTLTGSIGVFGGKIVLEDLLGRIGLRRERILRGEVASMGSPARGYDDEERRRLEAEIHAMYQQFVAKVAEGRRLDTAQVEGAAQGRVWTGRKALEQGLVDELGGIAVAIARCKEAARRTEGERLDVVDIPLPRKGQGLLRPILGARAFSDLTVLAALAESRLWTLMPWGLE